jgi:hypothetical protein
VRARRRSGKMRNVEGQSDCVGMRCTKDEQHRLFLYVSTRAIAALMRSHAVCASEGAGNLETPCQRSGSSLSGFAALSGHLQAGRHPHIEDDWPDQSRGASLATPGRSTLSTARASGVLECRKWCRRSHPKETLRLAHVRHASAEPSSLFTIVAWSPWSLAVWLRDCDLLYAICRKAIVLPNPSVGLLIRT